MDWRERLAGAREVARGLTGELRLRRGTMTDYQRLAEFHYLRQRPATATRVLVLADDRPTIVGRYFHTRRDAHHDARQGARREKVGRVVAVLVESLPSLGCAMRNVALKGRYGGLGRGNYVAGRLVNADLRCISRVVVHPQWRGLGLAVWLVREALATMTTPYTEALAAMGRVHPFFELAGMRAYRRWPLPRDQRLRDALAWAGIELWELASVERMADRVAAERSGLLRTELRRWAGRRRLTLNEQLETARAELLCEPVYYLAERDEA